MIMIAVLKNCLISEECDYDHSPHKMIATLFLRIALFIRTATMIAVLFIKIATMIAIFTKCLIFESL